MPGPCSGGFNGGKHNWRLAGPYDGDRFAGGISLATRGRACLWCDAKEPDFQICVTTVSESGRVMGFWRCNNRAKYPSERVEGGLLSTHVKADADGMYWYCGTHSPERKAMRAAARPLSQWERKSIHLKRRGDLVAAARAWDRDEAEVEGFCDEACEHHECRLHRALQIYSAPVPTTREEAGP